MSVAKSSALFQIITRRLSSTAAKRAASTEVPSGNFNSMKQQQKRFQIDDHQPIYIKGGFGDKVLYGATIILTTIGIAMSGEVLYKLSFPKH